MGNKGPSDTTEYTMSMVFHSPIGCDGYGHPLLALLQLFSDIKFSVKHTVTASKSTCYRLKVSVTCLCSHLMAILITVEMTGRQNLSDTPLKML